MGITSTPTFEVRNGEDWITWTTSTGDTTSDKVARIKGDSDKGIEPRPEWAQAAPVYDAWKADKKAQAEAKAADEAKTAPSTGSGPAKTEATPAADDDDDDDDDKNATGSGTGARRTFAKGYKK